MISLRQKLTEIFIKNKVLSEDDINLALRVQKEQGGRLSEILIKLNLIDEKNLMSALSQGLGLPLIALSRFTIDPQVLKLIPKHTAKHYQIIPISKIGNTLTLAMADPLNIFAIDDVKALTGYDINPIIAQQGEILKVIEEHYEEPTTRVIEELVSGIKDEKLELIKQGKEEDLDVEELTRLTQETPVIRLTDMLLERATEMKASDLLVEPLDKTMRIRIRVDGILREIESPPKQFHPSIVSRIKVMADLNIAEHRLPQDGRFKIKLRDREVDFRVSILPSSFGEKVALRILDKSTATLDLSLLGFDEQSLETLKKCINRPHGMILACGPTGSGKTTTLYSILKEVDSPTDNIITVEDPVEYQLEGINQVNIREEIGLTFASALRYILRQDPDTIMIGEIRDFDTVDIAIKSALTGHRVLSTLHTSTAASSVVRLLNMGVEPFLITSSIICIIAQRLVRKICPNCKESYTPVSTAISKLQLKSKDNIVFYKGKGCKKCFNSGYSGRLVLGEVLVLSPKIKELILERAQEYRIKNTARAEGMKTLREDGLAKCLAGLTSLEEVLRVTAADEPAKNNE
ncbi:MAG: ATPase, T2SS/T4P/T4SS family [Candidatus Omnitrophica bacterium]|nr:ATPase, T2SS/T4P/T4SS family [Candidatus Omnitrophota bacterium]MDD5352744.1 ATPase, T2SS/T4P/T4SS family [Candidatus Omnitrophota bacterium]MDD5550343.1 ATPase, T2SS/T4P/T4SS family [Candidatus Omnitrophota bacterium]